MRAVETNVLVRLLVRDDEKQARAAEAFVAKSAWVSHLVLAEVTWVLGSVYELSAAEVAQGIEMLLRHRSLSVQDPDVVSKALVYYRRKPQLGFSDCLVLEIARKAGHLPLGTFDRRLGRLDGTEPL